MSTNDAFIKQAHMRTVQFYQQKLNELTEENMSNYDNTYSGSNVHGGYKNKLVFTKSKVDTGYRVEHFLYSDCKQDTIYITKESIKAMYETLFPKEEEVITFKQN